MEMQNFTNPALVYLGFEKRDPADYLVFDFDLLLFVR